MPKHFYYLIFLLFVGIKGIAADTLYTNPHYPPIVYTDADYTFYKYTPKYVPRNMFEAFKILGATDEETILNFKERSVQGAIDRGIYYPIARTRKEFCLEGYSNFVRYFHAKGIFYPRVMETYILLGFHQYLNQEKIDWYGNKILALEGERKWNRVWKKRKRKLFDRKGVDVKESKGKNKKRLSEDENPDERFWNEFEELK